jgi:hypothetical protein
LLPVCKQYQWEDKASSPPEEPEKKITAYKQTRNVSKQEKHKNHPGLNPETENMWGMPSECEVPGTTMVGIMHLVKTYSIIMGLIACSTRANK